jgi:hypothetical protein
MKRRKLIQTGLLATLGVAAMPELRGRKRSQPSPTKS